VYIPDTYFVVGHFHYTLAASVLFGTVAFVYFWFPKMFGRQMNDRLGRWHFWLSFVFLNVVFSIMMVVGLHGHMRRIADATAYTFLQPVQSLNVFLGWAALGLGLSQLLFFINVLYSLFKGAPAPANPWEAGSLAWTVSSPPPEHNYHAVPRVWCGPHEYGAPGVHDADWLAQTDPRAATLANS
jgi:cytochrome c oxidase subunit 1